MKSLLGRLLLRPAKAKGGLIWRRGPPCDCLCVRYLKRHVLNPCVTVNTEIGFEKV